jgi:hypothetical protein
VCVRASIVCLNSEIPRPCRSIVRASCQDRLARSDELIPCPPWLHSLYSSLTHSLARSMICSLRSPDLSPCTADLITHSLHQLGASLEHLLSIHSLTRSLLSLMHSLHAARQPSSAHALLARSVTLNKIRHRHKRPLLVAHREVAGAAAAPHFRMGQGQVVAHPVVVRPGFLSLPVLGVVVDLAGHRLGVADLRTDLRMAFTDLVVEGTCMATRTRTGTTNSSSSSNTATATLAHPRGEPKTLSGLASTARLLARGRLQTRRRARELSSKRSTTKTLRRSLRTFQTPSCVGCVTTNHPCIVPIACFFFFFFWLPAIESEEETKHPCIRACVISADQQLHTSKS